MQRKWRPTCSTSSWTASVRDFISRSAEGLRSRRTRDTDLHGIDRPHHLDQLRHQVPLPSVCRRQTSSSAGGHGTGALKRRRGRRTAIERQIELLARAPPGPHHRCRHRPARDPRSGRMKPVERGFEDAITASLVEAGGYRVCKWGTKPEWAGDFDAEAGPGHDRAAGLHRGDPASGLEAPPRGPRRA